MTEKDIIIQDLRRENAELRAKLAKDINVHTNADRIRAMSDEELAKFFNHQVGLGRDFVPCGVVCYGERHCPCYTKEECLTKIAKWLQQPAEG